MSDEGVGKSRSHNENMKSSTPGSSLSEDKIEDVVAEIQAMSLQENQEKEKLQGNTSQVLEQLTIDGVVDFILNVPVQNIITLVGAGISTSAGIPDFRSPGTGLYSNLQKFNLPYSEAIFELKYFKKNPKPFFFLAREMIPGTAKPTKTHYFIRLLMEKGLLLRHYTQNIDNLEREAGIKENYLVEAHGTYYYSHCMLCHKEYSLEWMKSKIQVSDVPTCESCEGIVKPDIVFFGENLPEKFYENLKHDFDKCDLLIIMGSSLIVEPFASLCSRVKGSCPRLLVNNESIGKRQGFEYDEPENYRDVAWIGDCDEFCDIFVKKLGWEQEFTKLLKENSK